MVAVCNVLAQMILSKLLPSLALSVMMLVMMLSEGYCSASATTPYCAALSLLLLSDQVSCVFPSPPLARPTNLALTLLRVALSVHCAECPRLGLSRTSSYDALIQCSTQKKCKNVVHVPGPEGVRGRNSDNSLITQVLGCQPSTSICDGMRMTYDWIKQQLEKEPYQGQLSTSHVVKLNGPSALGTVFV